MEQACASLAASSCLCGIHRIIQSVQSERHVCHVSAFVVPSRAGLGDSNAQNPHVSFCIANGAAAAYSYRTASLDSQSFNDWQRHFLGRHAYRFTITGYSVL